MRGVGELAERVNTKYRQGSFVKVRGTVKTGSYGEGEAKRKTFVVSANSVEDGAKNEAAA